MPASNWTVLLKLFLPSWNFFNDVAAVPDLEMQVIRRTGQAGAWQPVFATRDSHCLSRGFWNPDGNLELLERSWVERLADELTEAPKGPGGQTDAESLAMLARIVRSRLRPPAGSPGDSFRFRIVTQGAVLLVSPEFPVVA